MKKIAVFDLDHTLVDGNASYFFGKYLYRKGVLSLRETLTAIYFYALHKAGWLSLDRLHEKIFNAVFLGRSELLFSSHAKEFVAKWRAYFPKAVDELHLLQKSGYETLLLSSSPDFIVRLFAKELNFTNFGATVYQNNEKGLFSSLGPVMDGEKKASYLSGYIQGSSDKIQALSAYSDSVLDLPLLKAVKEPVAVNPDSYLRTHAEASGWRIISR